MIARPENYLLILGVANEKVLGLNLTEKVMLQICTEPLYHFLRE